MLTAYHLCRWECSNCGLFATKTKQMPAAQKCPRCKRQAEMKESCKGFTSEQLPQVRQLGTNVLLNGRPTERDQFAGWSISRGRGRQNNGKSAGRPKGDVTRPKFDVWYRGRPYEEGE